MQYQKTRMTNIFKYDERVHMFVFFIKKQVAGFMQTLPLICITHFSVYTLNMSMPYEYVLCEL